MPEEALNDPQKLLRENEQLRRRVRELEERTDDTRTQQHDEQEYSQIIKVLELRDRQLEQYAKELEQKNQQLQLWISSLKLYQHIFESDPHCLVGVTRELKVVLYNKATLDVMGESIKESIGKNIAEVNFTKLDPYIPILVQEALKGGKLMTREIVRAGSKVQCRAYPLGSMREIRGALLRIAILPLDVRS
jgi:PAS domain-containing protein